MTFFGANEEENYQIKIFILLQKLKKFILIMKIKMEFYRMEKVDYLHLELFMKMIPLF